MAANDYFSVIQKLYVAYFGRPADPGGLVYYGNMLAAANAPATSEGFIFGGSPTVQALLDAFGASPESSAFYANSTIEARVNQIYLNVPGRAAEPAGIAYWSNEITSGRLTLARAAFVILQAGEKDTLGDAVGIAAKIAIANAYTGALDTPLEVAAYAGNVAAASARALLAGVTRDSTVGTMLATIDKSIASLGGGGGAIPAPTPAPAPAPSPAASTFTLTTGNDVTLAVGGDGNDVFNANQLTFTAADVAISGGLGSDTLKLQISGTFTSGTTAGIETISARGFSAATIDATKFIGATRFVSDGGSAAMTFTNLAAATQSVALVGDGGLQHGAQAFGFASGTTANLQLSNGTAGTGAITLTGGTLTAVSIESTGISNTVGNITLPAGVASVTITASANLSAGVISGFAANTSLVITGSAGAVTLGTINANVQTLNASGLTGGGLTTTLARADIQATGGGGNDVINTGSVALTTGTVNAGDGTDRLIVSAAGMLTAATGSRYTNFEIAQISDGVNADFASFTGGTVWVADAGATNGSVLSNLSSTQAGNIQVISGTATTNTTSVNYGVFGASNGGQIDTLRLTVDDNLATVGTVQLGTPTLTGVENLEITANDNVTVTAMTGGGAFLNNITLKGAATVNLTTGAMAAVNVVINGSAATGALTLNASAYATSGISMSGGSGGATLTGTGLADTISGGAGADTITGGVGADSLSGGAGTNTFVFANTSTGTPSALNFDTITDWRTGTSNKIDFGAIGLVKAATSTSISGRAAIDINGIATFNAADTTLAQQIAAVAAGIAVGGNTAGETAIWQRGADAYLYVSDNAAAVGATDVVVKLTGVTVGAGGLTMTAGDLTSIA